MPKILFIQPTQYDSRGTLCKQKRLYLPGLAFPLLAALTPKEWDVDIILEAIDDIDFTTDADIIGIGTMGHTIFRGLQIAEQFKKRGKTVVMGGYMVSLVPDKVKEQVDSVIMGDAERAYPQLLRDYEKTGKIKTRYHMPIDSLNSLPIPRYDLLIKKRIGSMLPVQAGRGCNHTCAFCSIACLYKGRYFVRPIEEVIRDIVAVKNMGFNRFYLIDDNIISNPDYFITLCQKITPLHMKWFTQCSLEIADHPHLLHAAHRSGAEIMSFGIESITQDGLNKLGKAWVKVENHGKNIRQIQKSGILVSSEMILGTESDTHESIRKTYTFVNRHQIPIPRFYILIPIPGTDLYEKYKKENRLIHENYAQYDGAQAVFHPAAMQAQELTDYYWWLNRKVFSLKSIIWRTLLNPLFVRHPLQCIFAFTVNLHYRRYIKKKTVPNIF